MGIFFSASNDRTIHDVSKGAGWVGNQLKSVGSSVGRFIAKGAVLDATQSALQLTRNGVSKTWQKTKNFVRKKPNITSTPSLNRNRNRNQNKFKVPNNPEIISGNNAGQTYIGNNSGNNAKNIAGQKKSGNNAGNNAGNIAGQTYIGNNPGNNAGNIAGQKKSGNNAGNNSNKSKKKINNISSETIPTLTTIGGSGKKSKKLFS